MATPIKHDSNTDVFEGQLFVFVNDLPIAYGTNATLNVTAEEVDISNKMVSGNWNASKYGKKGFTIGSDSFVTYKEGQLSYEDLLDMLSNSATVEFFMGQAKVTDQTSVGGIFEPDKTQPYRKGFAIITSLDLTSTDGEIATCSVSFTGVGALEKGTPETPTT